MLYDVMRECRNFFDIPGGTHADRYTISGGTISLPFLVADQYFIIEGSVLNDGLHKYPATGLSNETFDGVIRALAIPSAFKDLADEIATWSTDHATADAYTSESFGGYTYTRATDSKGAIASWQTVFRKRLNAWRKVQ